MNPLAFRTVLAALSCALMAPLSALPLAAQTGAGSGPAPRGGTASATYRHPAGFQLRYPSSWRFQETMEGVFIVPGDAATDQMGQPLELFMLGSEDASGINDPTDPAIVAYFQQQLPGFRSVGGPERVETGMGPGAVLTFEGSLGGPPLRQRTYVAIREGVGVFLVHLAQADLAARRDRQAREIFQSFTWGEAQRDPALVGSWYSEGGGYSEGYGGDYASSGTTRQYWFQADGSARYRYESSVSVDVEGMSGFSSSGGEVQDGTWSAGDGVLYLRFQDGSDQEYRYEWIQDGSGGRALVLTDAEGTTYRYRPAG